MIAGLKLVDTQHKIYRMIALRASRDVSLLLGLKPANTIFGRILNTIVHTWHSFFLLAVMSRSIIFLMDNIEDMSKATFSFYCVAATALSISHLFYFIYRSHDMFAIFEKLQYLVEKSNQ